MGGLIINRSSRFVWIFADNKQVQLGRGMNSKGLGLKDADGLLLDGTPVHFASRRKDLGGGGTFTEGAFKVCDLGTMTIQDSKVAKAELTVEINTAGYICPSESAGYKTPEWCKRFDGWVLWPNEKRG